MGVPLTDYAAIRSVTAKDPELVLVGALNTWFSSVYGCETFHADVHAGESGAGISPKCFPLNPTFFP